MGISRKSERKKWMKWKVVWVVIEVGGNNNLQTFSDTFVEVNCCYCCYYYCYYY